MYAIPDSMVLKLLGVTLSTLLVFNTFHRLFRLWLAPVPGPMLGKLTSKWILFHALSNRRPQLTQQLHEQYGPIVQLAPRELSFSSPAAIDAIYGTNSSIRKSPYYCKFGRTGIFHMQNPVEHKERRKHMGDTYSMKAALRSEPLIERHIVMLLKMIDNNLGQAVDTLHWNRMMFADLTSGIFWGRSLGVMESGDVSALMRCLTGSFISWSLRYHFPLLHKLVAFSGSQAVAAHIEEHGRDSAQDTLIASMLRGDPAKDVAPLSDEHIGIEAGNAIFAATETMSSTLSYAQYELARHPSWQKRLRKELCEAKRVTGGSLDYKTLNGLPILSAVIHETLRLHPPFAYAPRLIPPEGAMIDGISVPGGTTVSVLTTVTQYNAEAFPSPEVFNPQRWEHSTQDMRDRMMVWSKGVRVCAGQNLALMELKMSIARMVDRYTINLAGNQTVRDMRPFNFEIVMLPIGRKCMLVFTALPMEP